MNVIDYLPTELNLLINNKTDIAHRFLLSHISNNFEIIFTDNIEIENYLINNERKFRQIFLGVCKEGNFDFIKKYEHLLNIHIVRNINPNYHEIYEKWQGKTYTIEFHNELNNYEMQYGSILEKHYPIVFAAINGHFDLFKYLINYYEKNKKESLHKYYIRAIYLKFIHECKKLNEYNVKALLYLLEYKNLKLIELDDMREEIIYLFGLFIKSNFNEKFNIVLNYVDKNGDKLQFYDVYGDYGYEFENFYYAFKENNTEIIKLLISYKDDRNRTITTQVLKEMLVENTKYILKYNNKEILKYILDYKCENNLTIKQSFIEKYYSSYCHRKNEQNKDIFKVLEDRLYNSNKIIE